jgi:hypothetical protein
MGKKLTEENNKMSVSKAQKIANMLDAEYGFNMVAYQRSELEFMKNKLEEFLDLEVETEELEDTSDLSDDDDGNYDFMDEPPSQDEDESS